MKILHILYSGLGGHGSVFFSLVSADEQHLFEYEALFNGIEDMRKEYMQRCASAGIPYTFLMKQKGKHVGFYSRLFTIIRNARPEIIFLHGSMAVTPAFAAGIVRGKRSKIIIRETQAMHMKTQAEKIALKAGMLLADHIVFLSNEYRSDAEKSLGNFYRPGKVSVIPNGIDLSVFSPVLNKPVKDKIVLGMQSRLVALKDHVTLLHSIKLLKDKFPDIQLMIAGDGEYRPFLEKIANDSGISNNVTFTGVLNEDALPEFLRSLDIYVHASLGETMSTAIMQAMACGLPIIASDVAGINNMISNRHNGILVPVKNAEAIADAVLELTKNNDLQKALSSNALIYARDHFSNKRMFEEYKRIFL